MIKKLIIFDMDGTITDTLDDLTNSVNHALKLYDYPLRNKEQIRNALGHGLDYLIKCSSPKDISEERFAELANEFKSYYKLHSKENTKPYEGMLEALRVLKERGYVLAVSTNKIEIIAQDIIDKLYPNLFATVCGDDGKREKKPSPNSIHEIMNRLNIHNLDEVIYVGDSEVDYQTAVNSKIDCLLVTYGYRTKKELLSSNLKNVIFIDSPNKLTSYFKEKSGN